MAALQVVHEYAVEHQDLSEYNEYGIFLEK